MSCNVLNQALPMPGWLTTPDGEERSDPVCCRLRLSLRRGLRPVFRASGIRWAGQRARINGLGIPPFARANARDRNRASRDDESYVLDASMARSTAPNDSIQRNRPNLRHVERGGLKFDRSCAKPRLRLTLRCCGLSTSKSLAFGFQSNWMCGSAECRLRIDRAGTGRHTSARPSPVTNRVSPWTEH